MQRSQWDNATWAEWHRSIRQEAAHVATSLHLRGVVYRVHIRSPLSPARPGYRGVLSEEPNPWASAVVARAGDAWKKAHESAQVEVIDRPDSGDPIDDYAHRFVVHQEKNIRALAKRLARAMPDRGALRSRAFQQLCDEYRKIIPMAPDDVLHRGVQELRQNARPVLVYSKDAAQAAARKPAQQRAPQLHLVRSFRREGPDLLAGLAERLASLGIHPTDNSKPAQPAAAPLPTSDEVLAWPDWEKLFST